MTIHFERLTRATVGGTLMNTHCSIAMNAEYIGQNLKPFAGNCDVLISLNIVEWDEESNKQINPTNLFYHQLRKYSSLRS